MEIFLLVKSRGGDSPGCCWVLRWVMELGYSAPESRRGHGEGHGDVHDQLSALTRSGDWRQLKHNGGWFQKNLLCCLHCWCLLNLSVMSVMRLM